MEIRDRYQTYVLPRGGDRDLEYDAWCKEVKSTYARGILLATTPPVPGTVNNWRIHRAEPKTVAAAIVYSATQLREPAKRAASATSKTLPPVPV